MANLELVIKTTNRCNAVCSYCSADATTGGDSADISIDLVKLLLDQAAELVEEGRFDAIQFLWHGGEPLVMGKSFFKDVLRFNRPGELIHRIQTNLTLLDEEWLDILGPLVGKDGIGTSFDPFADTRRLIHDDYRRAWLQAMALLGKREWSIGCVYVLHRLSMDNAQDVYWFFRNLRNNSRLSLRVNPILHVGRAMTRHCDDLNLRPGDYASFITEIGEAWYRDRNRLQVSPLNDFQAAIVNGSQITTCEYAGAEGCVGVRLGIDHRGNVYNCGRAVDAGAETFGNLSSSTLRQCLDSPIRKKLRNRERLLLSGPCRSCPYWAYCHGGCLFESHMMFGPDGSPTAFCPDLKRIFSWMIDRLSTYHTPDRE